MKSYAIHKIGIHYLPQGTNVKILDGHRGVGLQVAYKSVAVLSVQHDPSWNLGLLSGQKIVSVVNLLTLMILLFSVKEIPDN